MHKQTNRRRFAGYWWLVPADWRSVDAQGRPDADWGEWRIRGRHGFVVRGGGDRLLAVVTPPRARVARRLGFTEVEDATGEAIVRGSTAQLRDFAHVVGFRRRGERRRHQVAHLATVGARTRFRAHKPTPPVPNAS